MHASTVAEAGWEWRQLFSIFPMRISQLASVFSTLLLFPPLFFLFYLPSTTKILTFCHQLLAQNDVRWGKAWGVEKGRMWDLLWWESKEDSRQFLLCTSHHNTQWLRKIIIYFSSQVCALSGGWSIWVRFVWVVFVLHVSHPLPGTNRLGHLSYGEKGTQKNQAQQHKDL